MKDKILIILLLLLVTVIQTTNADQSYLDNEIDYYADIFSIDNYKNHKAQFNNLESSGITSPKIYDQIAEKLNANIKVENKYEVRSMSLYAKILALSGNPKYEELLIKVNKKARSTKLRRHAKQSITQLENYSKWNTVLSKGLNGATSENINDLRLVNILSIYDKEFYKVVKANVVKVYKEKNFKPQILKALVDRADYEMKRQSNIDTLHMDTLSWLVKTIGHSGDARYKPFLKKMLERSKVSKVRRHIRQAVKAIPDA